MYGLISFKLDMKPPKAVAGMIASGLITTALVKLSAEQEIK